MRSPSTKIGLGNSQKLILSTSKQILRTQANPYLPTSEGLNRFLSAPNAHLTPAGLFKSHEDEDEVRFMSVTPRREPFDTNANIGASRMRIDNTGKRLPSVLKKALPLPPEDIRSVPHMRLIARLESPPVVSIGMADLEGIPIPWTKTPELITGAGTTGSVPVATPGISRTPGVEEVRQSMRDDFDNLEHFIEQIFNNRNIVTPSVGGDELIFEQS
jgi:hypothetical protein